MFTHSTSDRIASGTGPVRVRYGSGSGTGPVRVRYGSGTGPVRVRYGSGTGPVRVRYGSGTGPVRVRYGSGTGPVRVRYGSGCPSSHTFSRSCRSGFSRPPPDVSCERKLDSSERYTRVRYANWSPCEHGPTQCLPAACTYSQLMWQRLTIVIM